MNLENKVKWCPVCEQGWVKIVKEINTDKLYLCCSECEAEWSDPDKIEENTCLPFNFFEKYIIPTEEDIKKKGWDKYIIK